MSDTTTSITVLALIKKYYIPGQTALIVIALLIVSLDWISVACADPVTSTELSQSEQWVSNQLAEGKPVDFSKYKGSNIISSWFLQALLSGDKRFQISHNGIQIKNAIITGKLNLKGAVVSYLVSITHSILRDDVSLTDNIFKQDLIFDDSQFLKDADFSSSQVERDASFSQTSFNGQTDFSGAKIGRLFLANGASFNNIHIGSSDFDQSEFDVCKKDARMLCEAIERERYGVETEPCGRTLKDNIKWLNKLLGRHDLYEKISAKKHLTVTEEMKILKQRTDNRSIKQLNRFTLELAHPEETPKRIAVFFTALETGHNVHLDGASFHGPVDFRSAIIGRALYADYASFSDIANFSGLKDRGIKTTLIAANFQGPFYLDEADIAGDLIITGYAQFSAPVSFYGTTIGADLKIEGASFNSLYARNMTVKGPATLSNVTIKTAATFQNSNFQSLTFDKVHWPDDGMIGKSAEFSSDEFESVKAIKNLCETLIDDNIKSDTMEAHDNTIDWLNEILKSPDLYDEVVVKHPHLTLTAEIMNLKKQVDQNHKRPSNKYDNNDEMAVKRLNRLLIELAYPLESPRRGLSIDGLTYRGLSVISRSKSKVRPERPEVELLEESRFNIQNYIELESFFKRSGHENWADEVYIKGRELELQNRKPVELGDLLTYVFWDKLAGFGRRPFRIIYVSIIILLLGATVFNPKYLDDEFKSKWGLPDHEWDTPALRILPELRRMLLSLAVRIGLSLDVFVPTHHPGLLDHWRRSAIPTGVLVYYYFHKFCGMILVPIAAAAFFTHLKIALT